MKLFGYELKKTTKEKIIIINQKTKQIIIEGNGWLNPPVETFLYEFAQIINQMPEKLTLDEKINIFKLFNPDSEIEFKIV